MKYIVLLLSISLLLNKSNAQEDSRLIEGNNEFALSLYKKIYKTHNNFIFSPYSITSTFSMVYIGAKNQTSEEIKSVFSFDNKLESLAKDYNSLFTLKQNSKSSVQFYNANAIWIQDGLDINQSFIDFNKKHFSSTIFEKDFIKNPEESRITINNWVQKNTNNRIINLLKPAHINQSTRMVLTNAIYFKGAWLNKFNKENNTIDNFQINKKMEIKTSYMNQQINSWYYDDKYAQIADIKYANEDISLLIILPKTYKKLKKLEKKLNNEYYTNYINNKVKRKINLSLPKFKNETELDLKVYLQKLGMQSAFSSSADFSGITTDENLYISNVIHKANISIDEEGTEAAAATAIAMRKMAYRNEEVDFKVNKPFIYMIRNNKTNCIYFIGKIINIKQ